MTRPAAVIEITGDQRSWEGEPEIGVRLWLWPFRGWDETHEIIVGKECVPRSFVVGLGPRVYARGTFEGLPLAAGDTLCLRFFEGPVGDQHEGWVMRFGKRLEERP